MRAVHQHMLTLSQRTCMRLTVLVGLFLPLSLFAQPACYCCDALHRQFNFWVGDWVVHDTLGNVVGTNQISQIDSNCVVLEHWTGSAGLTGTSINYFDKADSTWNQLWVDSQGSVLKLKGQFNGSQMVLKSAPKTGRQGKTYYNQVTWTPNPDGTVTQLWEVRASSGKRLSTAFKGIYHRRK